MLGYWYVVEYKDSLFQEVIGMYAHIRLTAIIGDQMDITGNDQTRGAAFIRRYKMVI